VTQIPINATKFCASHSVIEIPILGNFGVWCYFWEYLATSGAKCDIIFLLGNPNFL